MTFGSKQMAEGCTHVSYSAGFRMFTGTEEIVAVILLLAAVWGRTLTAIGSLLVVGTIVLGLNYPSSLG